MTKITTSVLLIASFVLANVVFGPLDVQAEQPDCAKMGDIADTTMFLRQHGTPMSELMGDAGHDPSSRWFVIEAYKVHRYGTDAGVERAILAFRNKVEAICYGVEVTNG